MPKPSLFLVVVLVLFVSAGLAQTTTPYQGKPQVIPGRIQGEFYDNGGAGVAYNDVDPVNNGSGKLNKGDTDLDKFRQNEGVDISYTKPNLDKDMNGAPEKTGELYLGWTAPGEWVKYSVDVKAAGMYRIKAHISSKTEAAEISLLLQTPDGSNASTGTIVLPTTGHWHTWRMVDNLGTIRLAKGPQVMTLSVLKAGEFNIDYFEFGPVAEPSTTK